MKAIENFIIEATNEFGGGSTITEDQAQTIVKRVGRSGFGLGQVKQSKMFVDGHTLDSNGSLGAGITRLTLMEIAQ